MPNVRVHRPGVWSHSGVKPVACASKTIPSAEVIYVSVERIRAALGHHINDGTGVASVLGIEIVSYDTEFLSGIRVGAQHATRSSGYRSIVVVHPIKQEIIVPIPCAVNRETAMCAIGLRCPGRQ